MIGQEFQDPGTKSSWPMKAAAEPEMFAYRVRRTRGMFVWRVTIRG